MSIKDYELFIFDWDGTLSTSMLIVRISNLLRIRYRKSHMMKHRKDYIARAGLEMKSIEERDSLYSRLYDFYSRFAMPKLKPHSMEILKELRRQGKKIAIFSDSQNYRLMLEAKMLGVLDNVDFILSASSIDSYKPDPSGLMLIAKKYKKDVKKCLYVGDMPSDIFTAKFAGMDSCGLGDGLSPYEKLKEVEPEYIFRNTQALLKEISY